MKHFLSPASFMPVQNLTYEGICIVHWSLLVRSAFCPKKVDLKSGLTLPPGYNPVSLILIGRLGPSNRKDFTSVVDLTSGLHCHTLKGLHVKSKIY